MSIISPFSDVDFRSILLPSLSFLFGNGVIIRLCFSLPVQQNTAVHWHGVLFVTVLSSSFPVFLLPSSSSCGLIFPPHLCSVWLISSALLPESLTGLLSLITCTASPSLAFSLLSIPSAPSPCFLRVSVHFPHLCFSSSLQLHLIPSLGLLLFKPVLVCLCVSFISFFRIFLHVWQFILTKIPAAETFETKKSGPSKEPQRYSSLKKTTPVNVYFIKIVLGNWTPYRITGHKILKDDIFGFYDKTAGKKYSLV